jgi:hypothetical protein
MSLPGFLPGFVMGVAGAAINSVMLLGQVSLTAAAQESARGRGSSRVSGMWFIARSFIACTAVWLATRGWGPTGAWGSIVGIGTGQLAAVLALVGIARRAERSAPCPAQSPDPGLGGGQDGD